MTKLVKVVASSSLIIGLIAGCNHTGSTSSRNQHKTPNAFDNQNERLSYVESHYKRVLESGKVANAEEARALASYDYDIRGRFQKEAPDQSVGWNSGDKAVCEQEKFEDKLEALQQK